MNEVLSPEALALFVAFARDAGNWNGTPLVGGGNVPTDGASKGHLTKLKKEGLVKTFTDEGCVWLQFTLEGKAKALTLGYIIED